MEDFDWKPTRQAALTQLDRFLEIADHYGHQRNFDRGSPHPHVSKLSPYISHRVITETEIAEKVRSRYPYPEIQKFIQEVYWRTYWKGWLEMRPEVWDNYQSFLHSDPPSSSDNQKYHTAVSGQTGIDCFDHWVTELKATGYLHNHARMWFASIWIFTLELPWQWGAHFFYHHLLDADAASNTLSWRWVAGVQTKGKAYVASAENIKKYTDGRFFPQGQLHENPAPIEESTIYPIREIDYPQHNSITNADAVLLFSDHLEQGLLDATNRSNIALLISSQLLTEQTPSSKYQEFELGLATDFVTRNPQVQLLSTKAELATWLTSQSANTIAMPYLTVGSTKYNWGKFLQQNDLDPTSFIKWLHPWDQEYWQYAKKGYFAFKKAIGL